MQFGLTVAIAVLFSLAVARLITPMMAAYLMRAKDAQGHGENGNRDGFIMRGYLTLVRNTTRIWRFRKVPWLGLPTYYLTLVAAIGLVIFSVNAMLGVPGSLFPPEDESRIVVAVELPPGSTLEDTDRTTEAMRRLVSDIDGVKSVLVVGGSTPLGDRDIRRASFTIILDRLDNGLARKLSDLGQKLPLIGPALPEAPIAGRIRPQIDIEEEVFLALRAVPDVRAFKVGGPGGGSRPFSFDILSTDEAALNEAVQKIETALRDEPMLLNPSAEAALPRPEVQITPKSEEAARLGVTVQQIATVVRVATIGDVSAALGKLSIDNRLVPIRVQLDEASRDNLARISALKVQTATGPVPLSAVATVEVAEGPSVVKRLNRQRVATIGADIAPGYVLDQATERFMEVLPTLNLSPTVVVRPSGDAEIQAELVGSFVNAMVLGVLLMMFVLILLFHSVLQPLTIIFSLLLSVGGVAATLILTQNPLSMPVLIGILMLMGIVAKNAILLIDFAIEMRVRGMERIAAVIEAGHKRARPIVMTSIAMSAGMLPSALGVGEGGAFRSPMAIAVIGGIIVSTVLSLVVVPSMYLVMDDVSRLFSWVLGRFLGKKEAEPESPEAHVLAERIEATQESLALIGARLGAVEDRLAPRGKAKLNAAE